MHKILIVEDDTVIAKTIKNHIETWGCDAECVTDFKNILSVFVSYDPQLVLLDISLPYYNGYHWCSEIRKVSKVPIIFISLLALNSSIIA
jgi:DNA-binding response OmpR family regulator